MSITGRHLLGTVAKLGGAGAVAETLAIWDFLKPPPATSTLKRDYSVFLFRLALLA